MNEGNGKRPVEAVQALRARGVDTAEQMLQLATPAQILAACRRHDARQGRVGPGAIVKWIRDGEFDDPLDPPAHSRPAQLRARFDEYVRSLPVGRTVEPHCALVARCWPGELDDGVCGGDMVVIEATYPVLSMACDECGLVAAIGPRHLHTLGRTTSEQEAT